LLDRLSGEGHHLREADLSVDALMNRTELAMPPSITIEMVKGSSLYMVKAVISGGPMK
jgi:hypothetical protein